MRNNDYKPRIPDIFEALFDICYLLFDGIAIAGDHAGEIICRGDTCEKDVLRK